MSPDPTLISHSTLSTYPDAKNHRWEIVQTGDGRIFVRTHNLWNGMYAMLHPGYLPNVEAAHAEIVRQKAQFKADAEAVREIVLYAEEQ